MKYDLALFQQLNEEYREKPLVPIARSFEKDNVLSHGRGRSETLCNKFDLKGKRILEVGCGRGEVAAALIEKLKCEVVGVDIVRRPEWQLPEMSRVKFVHADLSEAGSAPDIGTFDFVYSFSVWEHVRHPFALLERVRSLMRPNAGFYLSANLHRGPRASHRYREVFFPWPHLLFTDEVFEQYYESKGLKPRRASWVNHLTAAHYAAYFEKLSLNVARLKFSMTPIDEEFYSRFEDVLSRYPRYDLERDFIHAELNNSGSIASNWLGSIGKSLERRIRSK